MAMSEADPYGNCFPALEAAGWVKTSEASRTYNCIAWAAGDTQRWWWPGMPETSYWPAEAQGEASPATFQRAFGLLGFERCEDGELDPGWSKLAFYALAGRVTHAARQLPDGWWTSKLGRNIDITHLLQGLEGPAYGDVVMFLRRRSTQ